MRTVEILRYSREDKELVVASKSKRGLWFRICPSSLQGCQSIFVPMSKVEKLYRELGRAVFGGEKE